jgi:hypothetical protein
VKAFGVYSGENAQLKDDWLSKTMLDGLEVHFAYLGTSTNSDVSFGSRFWLSATRRKHEAICQAIRDNLGDVVLCLDPDIQFFRPCLPLVTEAIEGRDIVFQSEHWPFNGEVNTGFVAIRCSKKTLALYDRAAQLEFERMPVGDQTAVNQILTEEPTGLDWAVFPRQIWARSHGRIPPDDIILHHANCAVNTQSKIRQLKGVRRLVTARTGSPFWVYKKLLVLALAVRRQTRAARRRLTR